MLGDDVIVEVVEVSGGTVRLAIEAPRSLPVYREELWLEVSGRTGPPPRRRGQDARGRGAPQSAPARAQPGCAHRRYDTAAGRA